MWCDLLIRLGPVGTTILSLMRFSLWSVVLVLLALIIAVDDDDEEAEEEGAVAIPLGSLRSSRAMRSLACASDRVSAALASFSSRY